MKVILGIVILFCSANAFAATNEQIELLLARAEIATNRNQWTKAVDYLDEVLKLNPIFQKAIELKISILEDRQDYLGAIKLYKRLIREEIKRQKKSGRIQPSEKTLSNVFSLARSYYSLYVNNRGNPNERDKYFEQALKYFRVIRGHKYALAFANYFIGHLHYIAGDFYSAIPYFDQADEQLDFKTSGEIKLLNRFFLAAALNGLGRTDEAVFHLMYVYQNIEKNKDLKSSLLEFLNSLAKSRFSGAIALEKLFDSNVSSLESSAKSADPNASGLANELRFTLQYSSYLLKRFTWKGGIVASLVEQDEDKFDEFSYRTFQPYLGLKYTKFKKEYFELDYSYSKVQTKIRDSVTGKKNFVTFSTTHSFTPGYTKINHLGDFSLRMPIYLATFTEAGVEPTQTFLLSATQNFYPYNQWFDLSPEFQIGPEFTGDAETDKIHTNLYFNNTSSFSWMLLRQSLYIERGWIHRSSGSETTLGTSLTSYIYINWPVSNAALTLNYTGTHELFNLSSGDSTITKHVFKIGIEKYF